MYVSPCAAEFSCSVGVHDQTVSACGAKSSGSAVTLIILMIKLYLYKLLNSAVVVHIGLVQDHAAANYSIMPSTLLFFMITLYMYVSTCVAKSRSQCSRSH